MKHPPTFSRKTVLITGGTGSFGHAFVEHLRGQELREIRVFSRDELKQEQMRILFDDPRMKFHIGDVRDRDSVDSVMEGVDYVFHAAALKQVPSCEFFPVQAVLTNVMGSHHVFESAVRHGVEKLVWLSTDKAVYPINVMGTSKALMEKVGQALSRRLPDPSTVVAGVRYGNVMCSRGSVIPLFVQQIREGRQITVTAPEMTRFMLPLPQAIELVTYAFHHAEQGNVLIRKAPACTVGDLVTALGNVFGVTPDVKVIGIRHGEKIHETLASREELQSAEDLGDYFRLRMDERDLNYNQYFTEGRRQEGEVRDYTSEITRRLDVAETEELLLSLAEVRAALAEHRRGGS